jgi:hypothetical protein
MRFFSYLIVSFLVCAAAVGTGCVSGTGQSVPATPFVPSATNNLSLLALAPAEVPAGFILAESREKKQDEVGGLAREIGWDGGYVIRYTRPEEESGNPTVILQSIAVYPEENLPAIIARVENQDRAGFNRTGPGLTLQNLGPDSRGFSAHMLPAVSVPGNATGMSETEADVVEIIFSRGTVFEVIRMSGPGTDVAILKSLAETAYRKIP